VPLRSRTVIARRLRRDAADVERKLWRALRDSGTSWKFRRQHPIGHHVADFACPARKLAIELDDGQHAAQVAADAARSVELAAHGYRVIRFWNNDVIDNIEGVVTARPWSSPHLSPALSAPRGGEGGKAVS
jgi:very-short-patch-repair endonuclease